MDWGHEFLYLPRGGPSCVNFDGFRFISDGNLIPSPEYKNSLRGVLHRAGVMGMSIGRACTPDSVGKFCSPGLKEFRKQFLHFPPVAEAFNQIHPYIYIYKI